MRIKCPSCFAEFDLLAALESEAGREFVNLLAKHSDLARSLVVYLSLFRSATRALAWDRALKLATEVIELCPDKIKLSQALVKAVDVLRQKQQDKSWKPLTNHNYLKRVLEDLPVHQAELITVNPESQPTKPAYTSKTAGSLMALEGLKRGK